MYYVELNKDNLILKTKTSLTLNGLLFLYFVSSCPLQYFVFELVMLIEKRNNQAGKYPFDSPSCCEPHYESEAKCKVFHVKIRYVASLS